jgi:hypothetical protein
MTDSDSSTRCVRRDFLGEADVLDEAHLLGEPTCHFVAHRWADRTVCSPA